MRTELEALEQIWSASPYAAVDVASDVGALLAVNERLWTIEDDIRDKERAKSFDAEFVRLARAVYIENDERAAIKRRLNVKLGSSLIEEKSYADYKSVGVAISRAIERVFGPAVGALRPAGRLDREIDPRVGVPQVHARHRARQRQIRRGDRVLMLRIRRDQSRSRLCARQSSPSSSPSSYCRIHCVRSTEGLAPDLLNAGAPLRVFRSLHHPLACSSSER